MRKFQLEDSRSTQGACRRLKQDLLNENIKKIKIFKKRDERKRKKIIIALKEKYSDKKRRKRLKKSPQKKK